MNDAERAFLRAIIHEPEDDAPRLVYADWLEEQGDGERAEFVRLQCRIAALGPDPKCERPHGQANPCRRFFRASERPWCAACREVEHRQLLRRRERELLTREAALAFGRLKAAARRRKTKQGQPGRHSMVICDLRTWYTTRTIGGMHDSTPPEEIRWPLAP